MVQDLCLDSPEQTGMAKSRPKVMNVSNVTTTPKFAIKLAAGRRKIKMIYSYDTINLFWDKNHS